MGEKEIVSGLKVSTHKIVLSLAFSIAAFLTPFFLGHPQILVGTLVNCLLFLSAFFLPFSLTFPVVLMPSLAALSRGLLFGPQTIFLYYLLPFIWFGNLTLVFIFKKASQPLTIRIFLAAFLKMAVLYLPTLLMVKTKILPVLFLKTMGFFQLETAILGGLLAFLIIRFSKRT